jgi:hypothetical protein
MATLRAFAPRRRRLLAEAGILVVLDNLETLLTPEGAWRDPRWGILVEALTSHGGESRVILTSRIAPAGLAVLPVLTLPVHSLSLAEAVALARFARQPRHPTRPRPRQTVIACSASCVWSRAIPS